MANARSRYDTIAGYLQRAHEVQAGLFYGKPCLMLQGHAFAAYQPVAMAFRLHGRSLALALALPGAKGWDPRYADRSVPGWILIPVEQVLRWDRLALDAVRCAREASARRISYTAPPDKIVADRGDDGRDNLASAPAAGSRSYRLRRQSRSTGPISIGLAS